ncbi:MAG: pyridoxamine 5'-phosphate oxidase family protein [Acidimicrobiales bacterium]
MGDVLERIDDDLSAWIAAQPVCFVATAPLSADGHVNVSPKGGAGTFAAVGPHEFAYLDLVGSGVETAAHLRENGRIVVMFCAFDGPPRIVRLHGRGRVVPATDSEADGLVAALGHDEAPPNLRAVIHLSVDRISTSCGFAVPRMDLVAERDQLDRWADAKIRQLGPDAMTDYVAVNNATSIDGLPGLDVDPDSVGDDRRDRLDSRGRKL